MRLAVTENIIFREMISGWPQISPLTRKWISPLIFTSIHFRKERESAHAWEEKIQSEIASSSSSPTARSMARSLQLQSDGAIDGEIAIAPSIAIWRHRDLGSRSLRDRDRDPDRDRAPSIAISDRDRAVDRDLGSRSRYRSRSCVVFVDDFFSWVVALCFLICVFLLLFQTPENIFRKIFWNANKHMETFSFSGN